MTPFPAKIQRVRVHFQVSLPSKSVEQIFCRGERLLGGLILGLLFGLFFGLFSGLASGLFFGPISALAVGLEAFVKHFILRFVLSRQGDLPWGLVPFLDEAAERLLLRKVGGSYIFVHRLLLEYFADLVDEE